MKVMKTTTQTFGAGFRLAVLAVVVHGSNMVQAEGDSAADWVGRAPPQIEPIEAGSRIATIWWPPA